MTEKVITATPNITAARAAKLMVEHDVGSIIVTKSEKPVGILTERDLLVKVISANLKPDRVNIGEIMSKPIITVDPDTDITEAARIMVQNRIRRLPVVDRGKLIGILTARDFAAVSPRLAETVTHPEIPTSERIEQSICEACGELKTTLYEVDGMWICESCRDALSERM